MRIKLINPNTTVSMTQNIEIAGKRFARPDTEVYAVNPDKGPESIECYYDEYHSIPGVLEQIVKGDREENADAFVIACFGDPGLQAAREITEKPVVGICQAAIVTAMAIAPTFSIISVLERSLQVTRDAVYMHGATKACCSIRATGLSVLEFEQDTEHALEIMASQSKAAVKEDGAEAILLGCAGMVEFVDRLKNQLGVPVFDGVSPAVKLAEMLVDMGCKTSKVNTWKPPEKKRITGFSTEFLAI